MIHYSLGIPPRFVSLATPRRAANSRRHSGLAAEVPAACLGSLPRFPDRDGAASSPFCAWVVDCATLAIRLK